MKELTILSWLSILLICSYACHSTYQTRCAAIEHYVKIEQTERVAKNIAVNIDSLLTLKSSTTANKQKIKDKQRQQRGMNNRLDALALEYGYIWEYYFSQILAVLICLLLFGTMTYLTIKN